MQKACHHVNKASLRSQREESQRSDVASKRLVLSSLFISQVINKPPSRILFLSDHGNLQIKEQQHAYVFILF